MTALIQVECGACHRTQLRRSDAHANGLTLEEIDAIGWTFDESAKEWRCPFCWEKEHLS